MKVAVVTNILTPYRVPLFEAMRARVEQLRVFVMAQREENRDWQIPPVSFGCELLPGWHVRVGSMPVSLHVNHGVGGALHRFGPDVVLSGGFAPANMGAWAFCRRYRRTLIAWGELSSTDLARGATYRRLVRRWLISGADGAIASSSAARRVFLHYGASCERVLTAPMPIDVEYFRRHAADYRQAAEFSGVRAAYPGPVLLSVGRLVDGKGYRELFAIYEELLRQRPQVSLLIVGDGPQRGQYESLVGRKGWSNVHFLGFQQSDAVARYLAVADVFVFPTLADPFGAVVCEAMAAELPVVSSVHAAATADLVEEGVTGFRIDPRDIKTCAATFLRVFAMTAQQRRALAARAYARVKEVDINPTAEVMVNFMAATHDRASGGLCQTTASLRGRQASG